SRDGRRRLAVSAPRPRQRLRAGPGRRLAGTPALLLKAGDADGLGLGARPAQAALPDRARGPFLHRAAEGQPRLSRALPERARPRRAATASLRGRAPAQTAGQASHLLPRRAARLADQRPADGLREALSRRL